MGGGLREKERARKRQRAVTAPRAFEAQLRESDRVEEPDFANGVGEFSAM
jgi:hypothetical protein